MNILIPFVLLSAAALAQNADNGKRLFMRNGSMSATAPWLKVGRVRTSRRVHCLWLH